MKLLVAFHVSSRILGLLQNACEEQKKTSFAPGQQAKQARKNPYVETLGSLIGILHALSFVTTQGNCSILVALPSIGRADAQVSLGQSKWRAESWAHQNLMNFSSSRVFLVTNSEAKLVVYISLHPFKKKIL